MSAPPVVDHEDDETTLTQRLLSAKQSLFKLVAANCGAQNWCANTLMAAALGSKILRHWQVPFDVKVGYLQFEGGAPLSIPTVWLETPVPLTISSRPLITFVVVAPKGAIATRILGQGVSLSEDALTPYFTLEAAFDIDSRSLSIDVLRTHAANLGAYLEGFYSKCTPATAGAIQDMLYAVFDTTITKMPIQMPVQDSE